MGKQLLWGGGFMVWNETVGDPLHITTTGTTTSPSTCTDEDPELYLTLLDADYAGGSINWCGLVFSQSDIQNGTEKGPACPTQYKKGQYSLTPTFNYVRALETWNFNNYANDGLILRRQYYVNYYAGNYYGNPNWKNQIYVGPGTYPGNQAYRNFFGGSVTVRPVIPVLPGYPNPGSSGALTGAVLDVWNLGPASYGPGGYNLGPEYFGSLTQGGIKYSWRQGNGW